MRTEHESRRDTPCVRLLIPAKGNSLRAPGKNLKLLPFTLDYVRRLEREDNTWVMTNCRILAKMASDAGARVLPEVSVGNDFAMNFTASYCAAEWNDHDIVVLLEPTKPFRQERLLHDCLKLYEASSGKVVTTGAEQPVTFIEWDGKKACRRVGRRILDGCVVIARCGDFSKAGTMSEFWDKFEVEVVWHEAPTGIDFDYPIDLETHLPTVHRMVRRGIYPHSGAL